MKFWRTSLRVTALAGLLATALAHAADVATLYTAEVPFDQQQNNARAMAYDEALRQVLMRVSGPELAGDGALIDSLFPDPSAYVVQFQPAPDDQLRVTFDGAAIEKALRASNQSVWGGDRPLTLVWLAVDWGQGERDLISAAPENETDDARSLGRNRQMRERMQEIADARGLPIAFPLMDGEDRSKVTFSDVWGGFDERVVAASSRYDASSILIGRVSASGTAQNRWTYLFGDEQRSWTGAPESVMGQVSGMLASEFAISGSEPLRAVDVAISGVTGVAAYGEIQKMLADIAVVDDFSVTEVKGDRIRYRVLAHGGGERLARALRFEGLLESDRIDTSEFGSINSAELDTLEFFYNP